MKARTSTTDSRTDWERLEKMSDEDIDVSDIPELDADFFRNAKIRMPRAKKAVSLRLDQDVLAWFKKQGRNPLNFLLQSQDNVKNAALRYAAAAAGYQRLGLQYDELMDELLPTPGPSDASPADSCHATAADVTAACSPASASA